MTRIEREKKIVSQMIAIYCKKHHSDRGGHLCNECATLLVYAMQRLDHCPKGNSKTSCRKCNIHCYAPDRREAIRRVMRYVGPRMIFINPISAIRHLLSELD